MVKNLGEETSNKEHKKKERIYLYIISGVFVLAIWIFIFIIGLSVNSNFYRVAIVYNFYVWQDWVWTILSFTFSNVIILAFLSGLLGGITSKSIIIERLKLDNEKQNEIDKNSALNENPIISGFRGVFVFLAILSFQFLSSFTDLSELKNVNQTTHVKEKEHDIQLKVEILKAVNDSATKASLIKIMINDEISENEKDNLDSLIMMCLILKDSIADFDKDEESLEKKQLLQAKLNMIRRNIPLPLLSEVPGLSSVSYFHFAVLVSFLSFIFGYDPYLFKSFLSKIPIVDGNKNSSDNTN